MLGTHAAGGVAALAALLAVVTMLESWIGHYRSGFPLRMQYAPLASGASLVLAAAVAIVSSAAWTRIALEGAGWAAAAVGAIGVAYHHYYGIAKKAGAYRWLLHYLMYGAPQLAPLSLSAAGALAVLAARGLAGRSAIVGLAPTRALLAVVAITLAGALWQLAVLHYRGAFNTPVMYAPLGIVPLAALGTAWVAAAPHGTAPNAGVAALVRWVLWATFLLGFVGLGFHLRGLDRQMGGLHLPRFNVLQGPPPLAPAVFALLAAVGLLALGSM